LLLARPAIARRRQTGGNDVSLRAQAKGWLKEHLSARTRRRLTGIYSRVRAPVRRAQRQRKAVVDATTLTQDLRRAGIATGDVLMIHSSLSRIGNVEGGATGVAESLLAAVGPAGTVMMPAYGDAETVFADLAQGEVVDLRTERSLTGSITEALRQRPGTRRSSHPFSSVVACGERAAYVTQEHARDPRPAHADSPLGRLVELEGKVVGLGVSLGPVSFYHVIEDTWGGFPFHTHLDPEEITYIDASGERVTRLVTRYDPEIRRSRIDQPASTWIRERFREHFERNGILRPFRYGAADAWVMDARAFYDELRRLAENGVTMYLTEERALEQGTPIETW
jgi:aminoglycoside 3-N-acetyltransferase